MMTPQDTYKLAALIMVGHATAQTDAEREALERVAAGAAEMLLPPTVEACQWLKMCGITAREASA